MTLQQQFENLVGSSLANLDSEDLKPVALGFWYEDYTPNLDKNELYRTSSCWLLA